MNTTVTFHPNYRGEPKIVARSTYTLSAPLQIEIFDGEGNRHGEITIFTGSHAFTARLIEAINGAAFAAADDIADANHLQAAE